MFAMVVLFGLFHGLIFVPVLLSIVGPTPTHDQDEKKAGNKYELEKNGRTNVEGSPRSQTKFPMA